MAEAQGIQSILTNIHRTLHSLNITVCPFQSAFKIYKHIQRYIQKYVHPCSISNCEPLRLQNTFTQPES